MISSQQKAIIRRICQEQKESFLRLAQTEPGKIQQELRNEGYEVSITEIMEKISEGYEVWEKLEETPEEFIRVLDGDNLGMVKHHLINEYEGHEDARPIWKQLFLFDKANEFRN
jgi:hypothetical protein